MQTEKHLPLEEIIELYPHQYVGLTDINNKPNSNLIKSATVKYTSKDTTFDELSLKAIKGEIFLFYTTLEEDDPFMNITEV